MALGMHPSSHHDSLMGHNDCKLVVMPLIDAHSLLKTSDMIVQIQIKDGKF